VFFEGATAEIPDAKVLIEIDYHETFESPDEGAGGGCSFAVGATPAGGALAFLAWLLAIALRRTRAR
jgi:MYXO-CTERM domain-containing protein